MKGIPWYYVGIVLLSTGAVFTKEINLGQHFILLALCVGFADLMEK